MSNVDQFSLIGKIVIITGGGSTFSLHLAKTLLSKGVKGITLADKTDKAERINNELREHMDKGIILFLQKDVALQSDFESIFIETLKKFKYVDVLINNAYLFDDFNWEDEILTKLHGTINSNLLGVENYLMNNNSGAKAVIINMSSIFGLDPIPFAPVSHGVDACLVQLAMSFGHKTNYKRTNVKVIAICIGVLESKKKKSVSPINFINEFFYNTYRSTIDKLPVQKDADIIAGVIEKIQSSPTGNVWYTLNGIDFKVYEFEKLPSADSQ